MGFVITRAVMERCFSLWVPVVCLFLHTRTRCTFLPMVSHCSPDLLVEVTCQKTQQYNNKGREEEDC